MDFTTLIDIFLHLDKHLAAIVEQYGAWVYGLLFLIIFVETGLVVMPFLPGDSLLFVAGAVAAVGGIDLWTVLGLLSVAAILGDSLNFSIGRRCSDKVFGWENSRFFNREAFDKAHAFYEKHGAITIIVARFMPFARTFVPFVAGVAQMSRPKFLMYNVIGGLLWVCSLTSLGFWIGNHPWVQANFSMVTLAMIVIPALPALIEFGRHFLARGKPAADAAAAQPASPGSPARNGAGEQSAAASAPASAQPPAAPRH